MDWKFDSNKIKIQPWNNIFSPPFLNLAFVKSSNQDLKNTVAGKHLKISPNANSLTVQKELSFKVSFKSRITLKKEMSQESFIIDGLQLPWTDNVE